MHNTSIYLHGGNCRIGLHWAYLILRHYPNFRSPHWIIWVVLADNVENQCVMDLCDVGEFARPFSTTWSWYFRLNQLWDNLFLQKSSQFAYTRAPFGTGADRFASVQSVDEFSMRMERGRRDHYYLITWSFSQLELSSHAKKSRNFYTYLYTRCFLCYQKVSDWLLHMNNCFFSEKETIYTYYRDELQHQQTQSGPLSFPSCTERCVSLW